MASGAVRFVRGETPSQILIIVGMAVETIDTRSVPAWEVGRRMTERDRRKSGGVVTVRDAESLEELYSISLGDRPAHIRTVIIGVVAILWVVLWRRSRPKKPSVGLAPRA